ncbi:hypothetical protein CPC16_003154 [Podila verticillata]|nr:hypothetical protein CPC16_003154 [Podila verticillata]
MAGHQAANIANDPSTFPTGTLHPPDSGIVTNEELQNFMQEVHSSQMEHEIQFRDMMASINSLANSVKHLSEAHVADLGTSQEPDPSNMTSPTTETSRSELAFGRGTCINPNMSARHNQQTPSATGQPKYEIQTIDPRIPLSKRKPPPKEYHTKYWYAQDNAAFSGIAGPRTPDSIIAQARKFRYYPGKALIGNNVDEWIDSFEKWHMANIGNPYTPGLDHEVLRLFASACESIPTLANTFDDYIDFASNTPTWAGAVHRLHMVLTTEQERDALIRETILEECHQGNKGVVEYNNLFNRTLYTMQRHGYNMLASRPERVALLYTRNLRTHFRNHLSAMVDTGLNYDTPEAAFRNIFAIQSYMERQGERDRQNHTEDTPTQADLSRTSGTPAPTPNPSLGTSGSSPMPAIAPAESLETTPDFDVMELVSSMSDLQLSDSQRLGVFRVITRNKNLARTAGAPMINLASASEPSAAQPTPYSQRSPNNYPSTSETRQQATYRPSSYTRDYSKFRCHLCGTMGHIASNCPSKAQKLTCTNCEEKGHFSELCPEELGPRVMWMLQQDEYKNGATKPLFENEDKFSEHDYNLWDQERRIFQAEWNQYHQYQDFLKG